jgi:hypothetical protein
MPEDPTSSPFAFVPYILAAIYAGFVAAIPFMLYSILRELRKLTKGRDEKEAWHQQQLIRDIRDSLKNMEAVGVDTEQPPEPEHTLPPVPQSIGPRRHQIRG